jgi:hypothetical protein
MWRVECGGGGSAGKKYFLYCWGRAVRLCVRDPEIAKEVFVTNHAHLLCAHPVNGFLTKGLVGKGLVILFGEKWATERRTINPFFHQDALKVLKATLHGRSMIATTWMSMAMLALVCTSRDIRQSIFRVLYRYHTSIA